MCCVLRKHMKVHGKDAVCQFDSDADSDDEASSPVSSIPGQTHVPPPQPLHQGVQGGGGDGWYCHGQSIPTPPSDHTSPPLHHTSPPLHHHTSPPIHNGEIKFENHQHSIGGLIGSLGGYWQFSLSEDLVKIQKKNITVFNQNSPKIKPVRETKRLSQIYSQLS